MDDKQGYVYILTNHTHTTFYIGVTSDLISRIWQHKQKLVSGFSQKYNLTKLVYYEAIDSIGSAIGREKYLKGKSRMYKLLLITEVNPTFEDLYHEILE